MKKEEIFTLIVVILIIIGEIFSNMFTKKSMEEMEKRLEDFKMISIKNIEEKSISKEDMIGKVHELVSFWRGKVRVLAYFLEHEDLENVEIQLNECISYLEVDEPEETVSRIEETIYDVNNIKDKQKVCLKNIF